MNQVHRQLLFDAILAITALVMSVAFGLSKCSRRHDPVAGEPLLPKAAAENCQRLMLQRGTVEIRLSKKQQAGSWVIDEHQFPRGGSAAVEKILAALGEIRVIRHLEGNLNTGELQRLGLQPPAFIWTIGGNEQSWVVKFGRTVPGADQGTYIAVASRQTDATPQIYAADADLAALDLTQDQVIDPVLLRARELDIEEMRYDSAQSRFHVRRDQDGTRWRESEAPGCRIDPEQTSALLDELERLTPASGNGNAKPGSGDGLLSGVLRLRARLQDATIEFVGSCSQAPGLTRMRVTRQATAEYCVDAGALAQLLRRGLTCDTRLFALRVDEVESLKVNLAGKVEELRRDGLGFVFEQQGPSFIEVEVGNGYLAQLLGARGRPASAVDAVGRTLSESGDYIRLRSSVIGTGDYEEKLLVGPLAPDGTRVVRRLDDNAVLVIDKTAADLIRIGRHVLKQPPSAPLDAGQVE